uniref:Uncharacterized protein n=1 Tax=Romanomermis culicivorax TaxID=13658 RepID=A0A915KKT0_ROMCU
MLLRKIDYLKALYKGLNHKTNEHGTNIAHCKIENPNIEPSPPESKSASPPITLTRSVAALLSEKLKINSLNP